MSRIVRVLTIIRELNRRWCTIKHLVAQTGVSEKSVRRDIAAIQAAGIRLRLKEEDHGRRKWRIK